MMSTQSTVATLIILIHLTTASLDNNDWTTIYCSSSTPVPETTHNTITPPTTNISTTTTNDSTTTTTTTHDMTFVLAPENEEAILTSEEDDGAQCITADQPVTLELDQLLAEEDMERILLVHNDKPQCPPDPAPPDVCQTEHTNGRLRMVSETTATLHVDGLPNTDNTYTLCLQYGSGHWQGSSSSLCTRQQPRTHLMPLPLEIGLLLLLLCMSGVFSGLNLGLMTLDINELTAIINAGTERERVHARRILPVRRRGNHLLCAILLGNVVVNVAATLLIDDLIHDFVVNLVLTPFIIVVVGEIVPQAVCSKYGLAVGANTVWFTWAFLFATSIISWPISLVLDWLLGKETPRVYSQRRLAALIRLNMAEKDKSTREHLHVVAGALEYTKKTAGMVMTKIQDVYMVPTDLVLNAYSIAEIVGSGFTRIPVFEGAHTNITSILNVKDLALLDPDDNLDVKSLTQFYKRNLKFVDEETSLKVLLKEFKTGSYHLAIVVRQPKTDTAQSPTQTQTITQSISTITTSARSSRRLKSSKRWPPPDRHRPKAISPAKQRTDQNKPSPPPPPKLRPDKLLRKRLMAFSRKSVSSTPSSSRAAAEPQQSQDNDNSQPQVDESVTTTAAVEQPAERQVIGVVSLEDVIEEIIQGEIYDEHDRVTANRKNELNVYQLFIRQFAAAHGPRVEDAIQQLRARQPAFKHDVPSTPHSIDNQRECFALQYIEDAVLQRLIGHAIKLYAPSKTTASKSYWPKLYKKGRPSDKYIFVLEGKVTLRVGRKTKELIETSAPLEFGAEVLKKLLVKCKQKQALPSKTGDGLQFDPAEATFVPDYDVMLTHEATYLEVSAGVYFSAFATTAINRSSRGWSASASAGSQQTKLDVTDKTQDELSGSVDTSHSLDSKTSRARPNL